MKQEEKTYDNPILDWLVSTGRDPKFVSIEALRLLSEFHENNIPRYMVSRTKYQMVCDEITSLKEKVEQLEKEKGEFAEWTQNNHWQYFPGSKDWINYYHAVEKRIFTTEQLIQLWKESK